MKAKRAYLTKRERNAMERQQGFKCFTTNCTNQGPYIAEHWHPVALGNAEKPDCLLCEECADKKTNGLRGDKSTIARTKRHRNGKTQYDKRKASGGTRIRGRGFDKSKSRGFDGKVRDR